MLQAFPKVGGETSAEKSKAMKALIVLLGALCALVAARTGLIDTKAIEGWSQGPSTLSRMRHRGTISTRVISSGRMKITK